MKYKQMDYEERSAMGALRLARRSIAEIAGQLKRHRSTLYRELKRNRSPTTGKYAATIADSYARARRRRSRRNLRFGQESFEPVEGMIRGGLSPEQIAGRRKLEGERTMSHETIYRWIWRDKRQGGDLWTHLRGARKQRRKRYGRYDSRGRLAGKKMIGSRPAVVEGRGRIDDWEIDTVHGTSKASLVTVVERRSGLVRIGKLRRATKEETTRKTIGLLFGERKRVRTITADNGCEFHDCKLLEKALETKVYFATPHHA